MLYCPKCQTAVETTTSTVCSDCGELLIGINDLTEVELDSPVVLTVCDTAEEALVLRTALANQGIAAFIEDEGLFESINSYPSRLNEGPRVMVRVRDAEAALDFLRQKRAGELTIVDEDIAAESEPPAIPQPDEAEATPPPLNSEDDPDSLVVLKCCATIGEAEVLKTALSAQGIESIVEEATLSSALTPCGRRGGATGTRVMIRKEDAEDALAFLRAKEAGELTLSEDSQLPPPLPTDENP